MALTMLLLSILTHCNNAVNDFRIGIQLCDGGSCVAGAAGYTPYARDGGGWSPWVGDQDYYDPDRIRVGLFGRDNTLYSSPYIEDIDIRFAIQITDDATDTSGNPSYEGATRYTPWATLNGGWTAYACDSDCADFDAVRVRLETQSSPGTIINSVQIGVQATDDGTNSANQGAAKYSSTIITPSNMINSWTDYAGDTDNFDPDSVRIYLGVVTSTHNPTLNPTIVPTQLPTVNPTVNPTGLPTKDPTQNPTKNPTNIPSKFPTYSQTLRPTAAPFPSGNVDDTTNTPIESTMNEGFTGGDGEDSNLSLIIGLCIGVSITLILCGVGIYVIYIRKKKQKEIGVANLNYNNNNIGTAINSNKLTGGNSTVTVGITKTTDGLTTNTMDDDSDSGNDNELYIVKSTATKKPDESDSDNDNELYIQQNQNTVGNDTIR